MQLGGLAIAAVFALALFIGRRLILRALAPLHALQAPLARLAQGDTDVQVIPAGDREIAAIGSALNVTITAIRQRDEELRRLAENDPLTGLAEPDLVHARTRKRTGTAGRRRRPQRGDCSSTSINSSTSTTPSAMHGRRPAAGAGGQRAAQPHPRDRRRVALRRRRVPGAGAQRRTGRGQRDRALAQRDHARLQPGGRRAGGHW
ncbi:MAG: methyl-accepting chemotaxis protein [Chromatiales bacterium]|nr:methyl-accepting chemotaxis protein [Chromatiales bacterium]